MMKTLIVAAAAMLIPASAFADGDGHAATPVALDDVAWVDAPLPGVQLALAAGDDAARPRWLIKMDPGAALPMHAHVHDYWGLSLQGAWVHIDAEGAEVATGPGDRSLVRGGEVHADRCDGDIPCIGLFDFAGIAKLRPPNRAGL